MVKRGSFFFIIMIFSAFLSLSLVSANFACGTVVILNNSSSLSPSWVNVKLYYPEKPAFLTTCQVSPENNKYCCNPKDIVNVTWAIGKNVTAYINEQGYFAQSVSKTISGAGYDIFPDLQLEKLVEIIEPNASIYLNINSLKVSTKIASKYDKLGYILEKNNYFIEQKEICTSCHDAEFNLTNLSNGRYDLHIKAYNNNEEYLQNFTFYILSYINFDRKIECIGCKDLKVPSTAEIVNITIILNTSDIIKGTLKDIFPSDWIYQGNDQTEQYSDSHNAIVWNFEGNNIIRQYSLIPPKNIFNAKYTFQSALDQFYSSENSVSLNRFSILNFAGFRKVYIKNLNPENLVRNVQVTNENPAVIYPKGLEVTQVALFPIYPAFNVMSFVKRTAVTNIQNSKSSFIIWSSLNQTNVDNLLIEFSINKKSIKKNQNVSLYYYDSSLNAGLNLPLTVLNENKTQINYRAFNNKTGGYSIVIS